MYTNFVLYNNLVVCSIVTNCYYWIRIEEMFRNCYFSITIFLSELMKTYMIIYVCVYLAI